MNYWETLLWFEIIIIIKWEVVKREQVQNTKWCAEKYIFQKNFSILLIYKF